MSNIRTRARAPLSDTNAEPWRGPLRERIDRATIFCEPLYIDGLDLLRLIDQYLPFWLNGARLIVVPDILVGRYIRDAYAEAGEAPPPIHVEVGHG